MQGSHLDAPPAEKVSLAQGEHWPPVPAVPAAQGLHEPFWSDWPSPHLTGEQEVWPVIPLVVLPEPQGTHCSQEDSYVSAGQAVHCEAPEEEMLPGEQAVQDVPSLLNCPAGQFWHLPFSGA